MARAREALLREFKNWGVSSGSDSQADAVLRQVLASQPAGASVITAEVREQVDPLEPTPASLTGIGQAARSDRTMVSA